MEHGRNYNARTVAEQYIWCSAFGAAVSAQVQRCIDRGLSYDEAKKVAGSGEQAWDIADLAVTAYRHWKVA